MVGLNLEPGRTYENTKNLLQRLQLEEDLQRGERALQMKRRIGKEGEVGENYLEMGPESFRQQQPYVDLASLPLVPFDPKCVWNHLFIFFLKLGKSCDSMLILFPSPVDNVRLYLRRPTATPSTGG